MPYSDQPTHLPSSNQDHQESVDSLISASWVIPIEPLGTTLNNHTIAIKDGVIVAVVPTEQAQKRFQAKQSLAMPGCALMPGLINLHSHAAMSLLRGVGDDLPLMQWLEKRIWPLEAGLMSDAFVYDGSVMAFAEMLCGGITCCNDMYFFQTGAARAAHELGIRAVIGITALEFATPCAADFNGYLEQGLIARDLFKDKPRIHFALAPHAPYTVSDASFTKIRALADQLNLLIHIHVHETPQEISDSLTIHGCRPITRLANLGLLGPDVIAVHAVHLNHEDIHHLKKYQSSVAHCPISNLKLASGIANISALLKAEINIGIGTDGSASNNRLDMFQEMRVAALLAKGISGQADCFTAAQVLHAATLGGAQALGLAKEIGSLTVGKQADIIAVQMNNPEQQPVYDPISHLVYVCGRENVEQVWISGETVAKKRQPEGGQPGLMRHDILQESTSRTPYWFNKAKQYLG